MHWPTHKSLCKRTNLSDGSEEKKISSAARRVLQPKKCDIQNEIKKLTAYVVKNNLVGYNASIYMNSYTEDEYQCPCINKLPSSEVRTLMGLAFFRYGLDNQSLHTYCTKIPGIEVVAEASKGQCSNQVFGEKNWYRNNPRILGDVHGYYREVMDYLSKQGYKKVKEPKAGDVIAYATHCVSKSPGVVEVSKEPKVAHYGIVVSVTENGGKKTILVESKFLDGPVVRHSVENVLHIYGSVCVFLREA